MREAFNATGVSIGSEDDQLTLAVFNDNNYVFFQSSTDKKHFNDGVYVEYQEQVQGGFDVIKRISLSHECLTIDLKSPLLKLPDVEGFDITLNCDEAELVLFGRELQSVFDGRLVGFEMML